MPTGIFVVAIPAIEAQPSTAETLEGQARRASEMCRGANRLTGAGHKGR